jgi:hypothetical protein
MHPYSHSVPRASSLAGLGGMMMTSPTRYMINDINPITEITHSPLYPMVLLTIYLFAIGFTIGNYTGYFRFNKDVYGDSFNRAYLAFTVLGAAAYFFFAGVAWLWAAKYVHSVESRLRKLTFGFIMIFLFHDLPCFSMELHAILTYGWRNGYQGFCFVLQIITFLLSFTNGWLYFTWTTAGWLQYWYGWPHESFGLKTGQEVLEILPPMSPVGNNQFMSPREQQVGVLTPMLGSGLRWNNTSQARQQPQQQESMQPMVTGQTGPASGMRSGSRRSSLSRNDNIAPTMTVMMSSSPRSAPNSGLRRGNPPGAFQQQQQQQGYSPSTTNSSRGGGPVGPSSYNFNERTQSRIRPVTTIEGLEEDNESEIPSSSRSGGIDFGSNNANNDYNINSTYKVPQSLMPSNVSSPQAFSSRVRMTSSGNYPAVSENNNNNTLSSSGTLLRIQPLSFTGGNNNNSDNNNNWRDLPAVSNGVGPNMTNINWNQRKNLL